MNKKEKNIEASNTFAQKTALLIGNGINRNSKQSNDIYNWEQLLFDLSQEFSNGTINNELRKKPFPMFYDAIVNYAVEYQNKKESDLKRTINEKLNNLQLNPKYNFLDSVECDEILTTNYDYLIEKQLKNDWKRNAVTKNEKFYSLSRFQQSNKRVWHIHGEQGDIRSMLLGFRLYVNYTAKIRERAGAYISSLRNTDKAKTLPYESWVDMFFTHNIHIIGLGMEFTEYTLWWLLAYRHFMKTSNPEIIVNNKILLHIPTFSVKEKPYLKEMIEAYDAEINPIDTEGDHNYDIFYEKLKQVNFA
jgi:hypothetical protein